MKGKIIILITGLMVLFIIGVLFVPKDKVAVVVTNSTTELLMVGEEERDAIREFIGLMAHTSVTVLPFKKGRMEEIGNKLRGKVTTFEFLWVVFSDPILVEEMRLVQQSSLKYHKFIEGLSPRMMRDYGREDFYRKANAFAKHLKLNNREFLAVLDGCILRAQRGDKRAFRPLIDYLLKI